MKLYQLLILGAVAILANIVFWVYLFKLIAIVLPSFQGHGVNIQVN